MRRRVPRDHRRDATGPGSTGRLPPQVNGGDLVIDRVTTAAFGGRARQAAGASPAGAGNRKTCGSSAASQGGRRGWRLLPAGRRVVQRKPRSIRRFRPRAARRPPQGTPRSWGGPRVRSSRRTATVRQYVGRRSAASRRRHDKLTLLELVQQAPDTTFTRIQGFSTSAKLC